MMGKETTPHLGMLKEKPKQEKADADCNKMREKEADEKSSKVEISSKLVSI